MLELPMIKPLLGMLLALSLGSCYYDNKEDMYGTSGPCDTSNVSYTTHIKPLMDQQCVGCHGATAPSAGISLHDYASVQASVNSGRFIGSVRWDVGYSPMPKGGTKWTPCQIQQLLTWYHNGMPQ